MKLYLNDDGLVVIESDQADKGTIVDDVMPPILKGKRTKQIDLEDFFYRLHMALAPPGLFDGIKGATKANPAQITIPPVDEAHYFLIEDGVYQHERLRALVRAVAMRWHKPPPPGFIWNVITRPNDYDRLEALLEKLDAPTQPTEMMDFMTIMMPPEFQKGGRPMTSDEADKMVHTLIHWVLREPPANAKQADKAIIQRDLMDLGLRTITGDLDRRRAKLAAQFIWSEDAGEPSYSTLRLWLSANDAEAEMAMKAKIKAAQKKKKTKRKQRKLGRKRR